MQTLIGNMTADQFTQFIGLLIGCVILFIGFLALLEAFVYSIVDGWLFRKGALYYGSLRYLNKLFKKLKSIKSIQELDFTNAELRSVIHMLRYQCVIPKIIYKRLLEKQEQIHYQRKSELFEDEYIFNPF